MGSDTGAQVQKNCSKKKNVLVGVPYQGSVQGALYAIQNSFKSTKYSQCNKLMWAPRLTNSASTKATDVSEQNKAKQPTLLEQALNAETHARLIQQSLEVSSYVSFSPPSYPLQSSWLKDPRGANRQMSGSRNESHTNDYINEEESDGIPIPVGNSNRERRRKEKYRDKVGKSGSSSSSGEERLWREWLHARSRDGQGQLLAPKTGIYPFVEPPEESPKQPLLWCYQPHTNVLTPDTANSILKCPPRFVVL
mmetsp:Transcript_4828/g.6522  ORF Transcript_4828/g.6522 Transcript_4828/m.6522 type:complete len:251 (+) Transcript_4828:291-1043(+)